jgi:hypothetical protein
MARVYDNYSSLIDFTRASSGTALRPISYGDELVTNGTFDSDSDWTKQAGVTISGGKANVTVTSGGYQQIVQEVTYTAGKIYVLTATVNGTSGESIRFRDDISNDGGLTITTGSVTLTGTDQSVRFIFQATGSSSRVNIERNSSTNSYTFTVDNVSVREVLFDQPNGTLTLFNHPTNIPRIEYDSDGNRLGLLVEESRTNLVTYSEDFSNVYWTTTGDTSISPATVAAPDGTFTAYHATQGASAGVLQKLGVVPAGTYTKSIWARSVSGTGTIVLGGFNGLTKYLVTVTEEWERFDFEADSTETGGTTFYAVDFRGGSLDEVYIWGAQLEAGSFPTSYIPTSGSTATRSADVASIGVSEFGYNQSEGTVFVEAEITNQVNLVQRYVIGSNQSSARWLYKNDSQNYITSFDGTASLTVQQETLSDSVPFKAALSTDQTERSIAVNGVVNSGSTNGNIPSLTNQINIGCDHSNTKQLFGHIKSIKYFPRKLTDAQLQELTS